jgi:hypothetical protein
VKKPFCDVRDRVRGQHFIDRYLPKVTVPREVDTEEIDFVLHGFRSGTLNAIKPMKQVVADQLEEVSWIDARSLCSLNINEAVIDKKVSVRATDQPEAAPKFGFSKQTRRALKNDLLTKASGTRKSAKSC